MLNFDNYDWNELGSPYSEKVRSEDLKGKVVLVVNVASRCGFTPQYTGLEMIYKKYHERGFVILGFPCNQFGGQEPGTDEEVASFCQSKYDVSFPIMNKIKVNGGEANEFYKHVKAETPGLIGKGPILWNFTKFLINREGRVVARYEPTRSPESIAVEIEKLL